MSIVLPIASDKLGDKGHSHMHRVYAVDSSAPSESIVVNDVGNCFVNGTFTSLGTANVGGNLNVTSLITASSIQNTPIGSTTRSTGAFTTLSTSGVASFTANTASTSTTTGTVVVTGGVGVSGSIYASSIQNTPIGSTTRSTGAFTTLSTSGVASFTANTASTSTTTGTVVVTGGLGVSGDIYSNGIQNTPIGSVTRSTGAFTTLNTTSTASLQSLNVSGTSAFASFTANTVSMLTANVASTSKTTGSLVITGGLGVSGDIYSNGIQNTPIGSVTRSTGAFTNLTANGTILLANTTSIGNVSPTEIGYLDGVESSIQTQIDNLSSSIGNIESDLLEEINKKVDILDGYAIRPKIFSASENVNVVNASLDTSVDIYAGEHSVTFYTYSSANNFAVNITANSSTYLENILDSGSSMTTVLLATNGSTSYLVDVVSIDGYPRTIKWTNGEIPEVSDPNTIDSYTFTTIKISSNNYILLGNKSYYS